MKDERNIEVSLALPTYNEEANIVNVLKRSMGALDKLNRSWEIIVIDNHSSDRTADVVRAFAAQDDRIRVIVHPENRLYSGSCATALAEAQGRYVAIMDSDGQFVADDLPKFLEKLESGANFVNGWRRQRKDPASRLLMSAVFNMMGKILLRFPLHDLNCGLRMFDRRFIEAAEIRHRVNMANPEFYVRAARAGLAIDEVEIEHLPRGGGATSHDLKRLWRLFCTVWRYFLSLRGELRAP